jgi:hypothetical protein
MTTMYKLVAAPHLLPAGDFKGHLETVTFIAANEQETHRWWAVNVGTFEKDFSRIVSPELAQNIVHRSARGKSSNSQTNTNWPRCRGSSADAGVTRVPAGSLL